MEQFLIQYNMKKLSTFEDFLNENQLNEGEISINDMTFIMSMITDSRSLYLQFIPNSNTLDSFNKTEQVRAIENLLKKKIPELADTMWYQSGHQGAGLVFKLSVYGIISMIEKKLKQ